MSTETIENEDSSETKAHSLNRDEFAGVPENEMFAPEMKKIQCRMCANGVRSSQYLGTEMWCNWTCEFCGGTGHVES